jgi:hypothetical protein
MSKWLELIGLLAITAFFFVARVFVLNKIWAITVVRLGAPTLTWFQMLAVCWFISAATHVYSEPEKEVNVALRKASLGMISLVISWGIAYLVFR